MVDSDSSNTTRKKPWALTCISVLAIGGLIAMPLLAGDHDSGKMPDLVRFFGHFHPVLLHLPIGVFALILIQELGQIFFRRSGEPRETSLFPLFFGAASAIVAVIAGFLLYHGGEEYAGSDLAERHLWGGLIFAVAAVTTFVLKAWAVALAANYAFYRLLLFASVGVMGFASHDGASMTHGSDYLTVYAPEPIRKFLGIEPGKAKSAAVPAPASGDQLVFADIVGPIFERRCVQCHKEGKAKGRFRMDSFELLVKGGKEGSGIEPGKSAESNVVIRMELPEDDDERMPPEGKHIEKSEIAIIKWWIDNGADPKSRLADIEIPAPIQEALDALKSAAASLDATAAATPHGTPTTSGPDDALKAKVISISAEFPGALTFESQNSPWLTFTAVSLRGNFDDAAFAKLQSVTPQLVTLDLSATKITDQSVAQLSGATNLRLIRLAETGITDASIDTLVKLSSLESINLYGTKVTDAGVAKLSALPKLKRLYLWQTGVTPEAIKALQEKMPTCEIIVGVDA